MVTLLWPHTLALLGLVSVVPPVIEYWQAEVPAASGPVPPALVLVLPALAPPVFSEPPVSEPPLSAPAAFAPAAESPACPGLPLAGASELEQAATHMLSVASDTESKIEDLIIPSEEHRGKRTRK